MRRAVRFTRLSVVLLAFLLPGFAQGQYVGVPGPGLVASSRQASLTGWFHVIWEDPLTDADAEPAIRYVLIDDRGEWTDLVLDEDLVRPFGGPLAFNRKRVKIVGESVNELPLASQVQSGSIPPVRVRSIEFEQLGDTQTTALEAALPAVTGPQPWVTILCRFADFSSNLNRRVRT